MATALGDPYRRTHKPRTSMATSTGNRDGVSWLTGSFADTRRSPPSLACKVRPAGTSVNDIGPHIREDRTRRPGPPKGARRGTAYPHTRRQAGHRIDMKRATAGGATPRRCSSQEPPLHRILGHRWPPSFLRSSRIRDYGIEPSTASRYRACRHPVLPGSLCRRMHPTARA